MTAQDLKNAILQLAVQGKLVPQDPHDEPASELLKRIEVEKAALIKAGRIKKYKTLTALSADDLPFDIPESWCWLKLGSICQLLDGEKKKGISFPYLEAKFLRGKAVATMINEGKYITKGTRLILVDGENSGEVFSATEDGYMGSTFKVLFFPQELFAGYVLYFLQFKQLAFRNNKTGSAIPHLNKELFFNMPFPVPPLAEQKRIVVKIEELMPLVEEYRKAEEWLTALNAEFPDKLRKSILQQAIQGKLTERNPADEPASELLKRIHAEKERLIKEGKIKKEKPLQPITEEEMPFEIPDGWKWIRFSDIATFENGDRSNRYPVEQDYVEYGIPFFGAKDMSEKYMSFANVRYISQKKFEELGNGKLQEKDFVCLLRGSVGKCAVFCSDNNHKTGFICAQMIIIRLIDKTLCDYIYDYLSSPYYAKWIESKVTGTAVKQLPGKELGQVLIPLPPFAEQQRIVERVNELLAVCDKLK